MKILTSEGCLGKNKSMTSSLNSLLSNSNEGVEMSSIYFLKTFFIFKTTTLTHLKIRIQIKIIFTWG